MTNIFLGVGRVIKYVNFFCVCVSWVGKKGELKKKTKAEKPELVCF